MLHTQKKFSSKVQGSVKIYKFLTNKQVLFSNSAFKLCTEMATFGAK